MKARLVTAVCLGVAVFGLAVGASASPPVAIGPPVSADALAIQVVGADLGTLAASTESSAPPNTSLPEPSFAYPADGSAVTAGSTYVNVATSVADGTASSTAEVSNLSIFGGEITAGSVRASSSSAGTIGDLSDSGIENLTVLGASVDVAANVRVPLADWGYALLLVQSAKKGAPQQPSWRGVVTGLVVHLDADHGGLSAGSEIRIGFADAFARSPETKPASPTTTAAEPTTTSTPKKQAPPKKGAKHGAKPAKKPPRNAIGPLVLSPPTVTPKLTAHRYVFPIYGPSAYGDTFGAPRGDVSGGWHHGDDIFAPLGAPILAVADGTVFSVGWNDIGGWRLWLRDRSGNEFYYAHLSAYTKLARNGMRVRAGQVLAFVGNTGDAQGTPYHLHFEVHPVSMLFLGYDGAVNPTAYLDAWKRLEDVRILPAVPFTEPEARVSNAPAPGAILLESSDISTANGLDPGSLKRAMRGHPVFDVNGSGVGQLPTPLPNLDRA